MNSCGNVSVTDGTVFGAWRTSLLSSPLMEDTAEAGYFQSFSERASANQRVAVSLYQYAIVDRMLVCNNLSTSLGLVKIQ